METFYFTLNISLPLGAVMFICHIIVLLILHSDVLTSGCLIFKTSLHDN